MNIKLQGYLYKKDKYSNLYFKYIKENSSYNKLIKSVKIKNNKEINNIIGII